MAIYHFHAQMIKRSEGRSSVMASAYRAGEKLNDRNADVISDYSRKRGVDSTEIIAPENSPEWVNDRERLWNEVEKSEKRHDAQVARELDIAIPSELDNDKKKELVRGYVQKEFVDNGMVADVAYHDLDSENPHCHVMLTTRNVDKDGFGKKNRDWNQKSLLESWRKEWQEHANQALEKSGHDERIDHRTLEAQGVDRAPGVHLGPAAHGYENRTGEKSDRRLMAEQQAADTKALSAEMNQQLKAEADQVAANIDRVHKEEQTAVLDGYIAESEKSITEKNTELSGEYSRNNLEYIDELERQNDVWMKSQAQAAEAQYKQAEEVAVTDLADHRIAELEREVAGLEGEAETIQEQTLDGLVEEARQRQEEWLEQRYQEIKDEMDREVAEAHQAISEAEAEPETLSDKEMAETHGSGYTKNTVIDRDSYQKMLSNGRYNQYAKEYQELKNQMDQGSSQVKGYQTEKGEQMTGYERQDGSKVMVEGDRQQVSETNREHDQNKNQDNNQSQGPSMSPQ